MIPTGRIGYLCCIWWFSVKYVECETEISPPPKNGFRY